MGCGSSRLQPLSDPAHHVAAPGGLPRCPAMLDELLLVGGGVTMTQAAPARTPCPCAPSTADLEPEIIAFCCLLCPRPTRQPTTARAEAHAGIRPTCASSTVHVRARSRWSISGCFRERRRRHPDRGLASKGGCHFQEGNLRARKRSDRIREMLDEIGVGRDRLIMVNLSAAMAPTFVQRACGKSCRAVRAMGPQPAEGHRRRSIIPRSEKSREPDDCCQSKTD